MTWNNFTTKICTGCGKPKPLSAFGNNAGSEDGLQDICTICKAVRNRKYYSQNYHSPVNNERVEQRRRAEEIEFNRKDKDEFQLD